MTPSSSPSRYDEQAQRLAHCLALEIKKLDRKPPEHSSAWYDFERLGALAVTLGTQGAMLLVETGYLERALGSRRWKALASCCKLGLVPGHLVVQAYLGDSSSQTDLSADILDQKKYLIDLKFCTQAMLLDAVDPPQFGIRSASVAYNLWLELAMHSCSGAEVAEYASTIVSTFDPM